MRTYPTSSTKELQGDWI